MQLDGSHSHLWVERQPIQVAQNVNKVKIPTQETNNGCYQMSGTD